METILIKPELLELVKKEEKTTTCRQGLRTYSLAKTILKSNASEDFVYINVNELRYYKLKDVTDEMAMDDGFENRDNLIQVLQGIYQGINDESDVTIVCFSLSE
jgi:hypothetical protein